MFRCLLLFVGFSGAALMGAQTLRVRLAPETVYAGDAFRVEASVEGEQLRSLEVAFSPEARALGQTSKMTSVNGVVRSSLEQAVLAERPGTYRLERLEAVTAGGKRLSFNGHPTVTVRTLEPDPALMLALTAEPEAPLPGDEVTLTLTVRAPGLAGGDGALHSPFVEADIFGRMTERLPEINFNPQVGEDSPLHLTGRPVFQARETEGTNLVWRITIPYRAVRAGEQTFPAPILRDRRLTGFDAKGNPRVERCASRGEPLTVRVVPPPLEGRPEGFVGAIGRSFIAEAALDALGAKVGDPVRLTLRFGTDGDPSLLRAPTLPRLAGFRAYGEPVRDGFRGGAAFTYNLRPMRPGLQEVPPMEFAWFDRAASAYRTVRTSAVPLRVTPSAQLVLLGDDGERVASEPPPALVLEELPARRFAPWAVGAAFAGLAALGLRLLAGALRWLAAKGRALLGARRPAARACATLARTTDPAVAAAAVRAWAGKPALTPDELRAALPPSPEADEAIRAYAALEAAAYSGGGDVPEARAALRRLLPNLRLLTLLLALLSATLLPAADDFVREQAVARTVAAATPGDYAAAANLWLRLARADADARTPLLNAASCAFWARRPEASLALLRRYERLHGCDDRSRQGVCAASAALGQPEPWAVGRLGVPWALNALGVAVGVALLLFAVPARRLRAVRAVACVAALACALWAFAAWQMARTSPLPDDLPFPEEDAQ